MLLAGIWAYRRLLHEIDLVNKRLDSQKERQNSFGARLGKGPEEAEARLTHLQREEMRRAGGETGVQRRRDEDVAPSPPSPPSPSFAQRDSERDRQPAPRELSGTQFPIVIDRYRSLLESRALSADEFISTLSHFGPVRVVADAGPGMKLAGPATGGPGELLIAVTFKDGSALLLPSLDFITEFQMMYKETLEVDQLVQKAFWLEVGGGTALSYDQASLATIGPGGGLHIEQKGTLSGFER